MPSLPAERLAELAPTVWEETARRMNVVSAFVAQGDRSTAEVRAHAERLGVSPALFYKLLNQWDDLYAGAVRDRPARRPRRPEAVAIAREAIALCGPAATLGAITACATAIGAARGMDAPERGLVRREHMRLRAGAALARRLGLTGGKVVDASPMAVRVRADDGTSDRLAVLTVVLDASSGSIDTWIVGAGGASPTEVADLLARAEPDPARRSCFTPTSAVRGIAATVHGRAENDRRLRAGSAIVAAVGGRMARVAFLPRADADHPAGHLPFVRLDDLHAVASISLPLTRAP